MPRGAWKNVTQRRGTLNQLFIHSRWHFEIYDSCPLLWWAPSVGFGSAFLCKTKVKNVTDKTAKVKFLEGVSGFASLKRSACFESVLMWVLHAHVDYYYTLMGLRQSTVLLLRWFTIPSIDRLPPREKDLIRI